MRPARLDDWPTRLAVFVEQRRSKAFKWGEHDCVLFAADAVMAMTGLDAAAGHRGTYSDAYGAADLLERLGGPVALTTSVLGDPLESIAFASRGDIVAFAISAKYDEIALGVCLGVKSVFLTQSGLLFASTSRCIQAWRV